MRRALLLVVLAVLVASGALARVSASAASAPAWRAARFTQAAGWWSRIQAGDLPARPSQPAQPPAPAVASSTITMTSVLDWQRGTLSGLLVSNNSGGELRLADDSKEGSFTSELTGTKTLFNAIGAVWRADVPANTGLRLEVRGGPSTNEADLTPWLPLVAGDARTADGALALESVRPFPAGMAYLQLRATLSSTGNNATPVLSEIAITTFDSTKGPGRQASQVKSPAPYGPATLTTPPPIVLRETWGAPEPGQPIVRQAPKGFILHQIGSDDVVDPLPFLRAQAAYAIQTLGYDDMPFHFVVDSDGKIYAGRSGGPTALVPRFSAGDTAIHVALIGASGASGAQQTALNGLLAWLGQAYDIPPAGQHTVVAKSGPPATRPNVVAHGDIAPDAADRSDALHALAEQTRQSADQATVRARWYFAEGNPLDFSERLAALNSSAGEAKVTFSLLRQPGPPVVRNATAPAGGQASLAVNDLFDDTTDAPAIVESNAPAIAERFMNFGADITAGPGVRQPSRVWYFAEGSTENGNKTYLILFNPQSTDVAATITYMQADGTTAAQPARVPAGQRLVVVVGDKLPGKAFGARVIASQPIVAERTMVLGPDSTPTTGGVTSSPGIVNLAKRWYFAEGTTRQPFEMAILVLNPSAQAANVTVTHLTHSGTPVDRKYAIPPTTRLAIDVNEFVPQEGVATTVVADRPVAVERAMYWRNPAGNVLYGMINAGATAPAYLWRFADWRVAPEYQEYLLFNNPGGNPARVTVDFALPDGKKSTRSVIMAAHSRYSMAIHEESPGQVALMLTVQSTQPIVAERALYAGAPGTDGNRGGDTALGVPEE